jgi:hypothetical protein
MPVLPAGMYVLVYLSTRMKGYPSMKRNVLATLAIAALLVGGIAAAPADAMTHGNAAASVMHVQLHAQAFSGVSGTATLTYDAGTGMTTVKVSVKNLEPGSIHPSHIHAGKCTTNGPVIAGLNNVKANAAGVGTATTVIKGSFASKQAYVNVHLGPGLSLTQYTVLACGELGTAK